MASAKSPKNTKNFEDALARLERIAAELEAGELTLEKSLDKFAEGIELARFCNTTLDEARGRVELLLGADKGGKDGPIESKPFFEDGQDGRRPDDDRLPF